MIARQKLEKAVKRLELLLTVDHWKDIPVCDREKWDTLLEDLQDIKETLIQEEKQIQERSSKIKKLAIESAEIVSASPEWGKPLPHASYLAYERQFAAILVHCMFLEVSIRGEEISRLSSLDIASTVFDFLKEKGISQKDFAEQKGWRKDELSQLKKNRTEWGFLKYFEFLRDAKIPVFVNIGNKWYFVD